MTLFSHAFGNQRAKDRGPSHERSHCGTIQLRKNIAQLRQDNVMVMDPATGMLAEGYAGKGRMPEPAAIVKQVQDYLTNGPLKGKTLVVTAGGTREALDPVRYLGNRSSGKMGIAIAKAAANAGARVELIVGSVSVALPHSDRITVTQALSTSAMAAAVSDKFQTADALIMAAAVADFRPAVLADQKIKKHGDGTLTLHLVPTEDILAKMGAQKTLRSSSKSDLRLKPMIF